jgi:hypothetical protein
MFLHHATVVGAFVQNWQLVSSKGDHVTTQFLMQIIQGGFDERSTISIGTKRSTTITDK